MSEIYINLFKARENEYGIIYENGSFVPNEDFTFKEGHPYKLGLKKQTSDSGTQYISVRAVLNEWAIQNKPEFAHLKHEQKAEKQVEAAKQNNNSNDIDF
jgi:predicted DNA-binding antitoxin AbrB/MazE fold protein